MPQTSSDGTSSAARYRFFSLHDNPEPTANHSLFRSKQEDCSGFIEKISTLSQTVKSVVEAVDSQAAKTEREKLRAVGKRNQVFSCS